MPKQIFFSSCDVLCRWNNTHYLSPGRLRTTYINRYVAIGLHPCQGVYLHGNENSTRTEVPPCGRLVVLPDTSGMRIRFGGSSRWRKIPI